MIPRGMFEELRMLRSFQERMQRRIEEYPCSYWRDNPGELGNIYAIEGALVKRARDKIDLEKV